MKRVLRFTTVIAFMFVTVTSMANRTKLSLVANKDAKSLVFELDPQSGKTTIKLVDADANVIYYENVKNVNDINYSKRFDLKNLVDGLYYFSTEDALKVVVYTISIVASDVEIVESKEKVKPVFRKKDGMVYLNFLNLEKGDVEVKVYDSSYRLVFSEMFEDSMIVKKAFNFKKAYKDSYTVMVKDSTDTTYYEEYIVK